MLAVAVTVTVVADAPSAMLVLFAERVTELPSSSLMTTCVPTIEPLLELPSTQTVSFSSVRLSSVGVRVKVPVAVVEFAAKVSVMSETAA